MKTVKFVVSLLTISGLFGAIAGYLRSKVEDKVNNAESDAYDRGFEHGWSKGFYIGCVSAEEHHHIKN